MEIIVHKNYKSIPSGTTFKVPNFCVITGKNGSGKSHLLEAIANNSFAKAFVNDVQIDNILHIGSNNLVPQLRDSCQAHEITQQIMSWWQHINEITGDYTNQGYVDGGAESLIHFLQQQTNNHPLTPDIINIVKSSGKGAYQITESDVAKYVNAITANNSSLFSAQLAVIIKFYHYRLEKNELAEFRASKYGVEKHPFLEQSDFFEMYGPPPWELINDILAQANLPYEISRPNLKDFEFPYEARLISTDNGVEISFGDLSSGEKVLMSLATAIYTTTGGGKLPDLLLLDEPDAPLHPQFSKLLIEILTETIVKKAGVRVIITTHSPSTVAMAPNESVFEIDKATRTPVKIRNSEAVRKLTEGVDFLHISFENRRQIFVESKYDVVYFDKLFSASSLLHNFTFKPVFIEPHSGTSNCTDVITITNKLRAAGNDLTWGIVDFDNKNKSSDSIIVLGDGARYAIEHYLLDPIYVCLCLIRNSKKSFSDFGVHNGKIRYTDSLNLSQEECQTMVNSLLTQVEIPVEDLVLTKLENNFELYYPKYFLELQGHDYEQRLKRTFPELGAISQGNGDAALKVGIMVAIIDYPQFLPVEISETFSKILGPKL